MSLFMVNGRKSKPLLVSLVLIVEAGGIISSILAGSARAQYLELNKPSFAPPGWVFPIVWSVLYFLMAAAFYRILIRGQLGKPIGKAVLLFIGQLLLNYFWSILFFRFELYGLAFLELIVLLAMIVLTTMEFWEADKKAGLLMIPYILWVGFAGVLNYFIWVMN